MSYYKFYVDYIRLDYIDIGLNFLCYHIIHYLDIFFNFLFRQILRKNFILRYYNKILNNYIDLHIINPVFIKKTSNMHIQQNLS